MDSQRMPLSSQPDNSSWSVSCSNAPEPLPSFSSLPWGNDAAPPRAPSVPSRFLPSAPIRPGKRPRRQESAAADPSPGTTRKRNLWLARESRERKRLYVVGLEQEVSTLKSELAKKSAILCKYELIEKQRNVVDGDEDRALFLETLDEMSRTNAAPEQFQEVMMRKMKKMAEGRSKALEQLSQMMLEIAVPFSMRMFLWKAENNIDVFDPKCAKKTLGCRPGPEQIEAMTSCQSCVNEFRDLYEKIKARAVAASQRIRKSVNQIVACQKAIQTETLGLMRCMKNKVMSKYTKSDAELEVKFAPKLLSRPELSNAAIFQLRNERLWLDASTEAYLDASDEDDAEERKAC